MSIFPFSKRSAARWVAQEDSNRVVNAIREAEQRTSGEIRVFVETRCSYIQAIDRAAEVFFGLKMDLTENRNGVLIYVAFADRQTAIFADERIYQEMGQQYWQREMDHLLTHFKSHEFVEGIVHIITEIGSALHEKFPFDRSTDRNELPDNIVFGK